MKKIAYLFTALFAVCSLAGCGGQEDSKYAVNPEISGGSAEEKDAILQAINKKPIAMNKNGDTIKPLSTLKDESKMIQLAEDNGDHVKLTTMQKISSYTVKIEWNIDTTSEYYASYQQSEEDDYHKILEIKYQGWGKPEGRIEWTVKSMTCGEAAVANPGELKYGAKVLGQEYFHKDTKIAEFNAVTEKEKTVQFKTKTYTYPSTFDLVDYECAGDDTYSPYFIPNPENAGKEKDYHYMNLPGKVVYLAPDGNWGLMADGENVLELYAGSALDLKTTEYPNLANEYIIASGNAAVYQGNIQLGFITKISKLEDHTQIEEPVLTFPALKADEVKNWRAPGKDYDRQAVAGLPNSLRSVTGKLVAGSIKDKSGKEVTDIDSLVNNRFTFVLQLDDTQVTVAYDYHADKDASVGLFNALKQALKSDGTLTIKGTMRYSNGREKEKPFEVVESETVKPVWNLVPFLKEHVSVAD